MVWQTSRKCMRRVVHIAFATWVFVQLRATPQGIQGWVPDHSIWLTCRGFIRCPPHACKHQLRCGRVSLSPVPRAATNRTEAEEVSREIDKSAASAESLLLGDWSGFRTRLAQGARSDEDSTASAAAQRQTVRSKRLGGKSQRPSRRRQQPPVGSETALSPDRRLAVVAGFIGLALGRWLGQTGADDQGALDFARSTGDIRKGVVLLSRPGDRWVMQQQYFHKAVILIVRHRDNFDLGLILNRPTAIASTQLGIPGEPWSIWYGGDCEGITRANFNLDSVAIFCLHSLSAFAGESKEVVPGLYLIQFEKAQRLVEGGQADKNEFRLIMGYCGWGENQLQQELDEGESWQLVSIDQRVLMSELQMPPPEPFDLSALPGLDPSSVRLDDGIAVWRRLYSLVGSSQASPILDKVDPLDDEAGDIMLREWVKVKLVKAS